MMRPFFLSALAAASMLVAACGGGGMDSLCEQREECARKAGDAFSVTQCKNDAAENLEKADTKGCSREYDDYTSCLTSLEWSCENISGSDFTRRADAECGAKQKALAKCWL